jgi:2-amino-4-hydroxy-6-hydroxymethyldihydropteridine diphosphokinase
VPSLRFAAETAMPRALVALGANLGDRRHALRRAVELLGAEGANTGMAASRFYETAPIGGPSGQGAFLNAAVALDTTLAPEQLHALLRRIERELGRAPHARWVPRTIDLDLLLYDDAVISTPELSVPHPRMAFRRFVLAPAAEVAPEMVHPLAGWSIGRLLAHLDSAAPYVALLALPSSGRTALARKVARAVGGTTLELGAAAMEALDPSGQADTRPIQFLDRARSLLAGRDMRAGGSPVISDFYFDECLAFARGDLDQSQYERFYRDWAEARRAVEPPKLLVVLETWEDAVAARAAPRLGPETPPIECLRQELLALATREDVGPVLFAGRDDPQAQFEEITAAIAAMR